MGFNNLTEMAGDYKRSEFSLVEGNVNMEYSGIAEVSGRGPVHRDYDQRNTNWMTKGNPS